MVFFEKNGGDIKGMRNFRGIIHAAPRREYFFGFFLPPVFYFSYIHVGFFCDSYIFVER
jgi:hypothetical protein